MRNISYLLTVLLFLQCTPENQENSANAILAEPASPNAPSKVPPAPEAPRFSMDYVMGKFDPATHKDFELIDPAYADRPGMYLRKETYGAFKKMHAAAQVDGINLIIRSATRNFAAQKGIWEAKWTGQRILSNGENAQSAYPDPAQRALKILEYSSMPGTSRHHWGTDIDLNNLNNDWFEQGEGLKIYTWLTANAASYGFCQPYSVKDASRPDGYNEERWHWSYMPLSKALTQQAGVGLKNNMINGFMGAETAEAIKTVEKYVLGINPACLQ